MKARIIDTTNRFVGSSVFFVSAESSSKNQRQNEIKQILQVNKSTHSGTHTSTSSDSSEHCDACCCCCCRSHTTVHFYGTHRVVSFRIAVAYAPHECTSISVLDAFLFVFCRASGSQTAKLKPWTDWKITTAERSWCIKYDDTVWFVWEWKQLKYR